MSEAKHTPGPWVAEPHGNTTALYSGRDNFHHGLRLLNLDDGDANFAANVALISAAPDLLEACEAFEEYYAHGNLEQFQGLREQIRAAITKAKGG